MIGCSVLCLSVSCGCYGSEHMAPHPLPLSSSSSFFVVVGVGAINEHYQKNEARANQH